jgi:hypothetical protein
VLFLGAIFSALLSNALSLTLSLQRALSPTRSLSNMLSLQRALMHSTVVTGTELVKKMGALKISGSSRKHYCVPLIEFISDTEQDEKSVQYCAYMHIYSLTFSATAVFKRAPLQAIEMGELDEESDEENDM